MMLPGIFGENLIDSWLDFPFDSTFFGEKNPLYGKHEKNLMKTDIRETESGYDVDIDLPGFKKEEINARLSEGYLIISASKDLDEEEKDKDGRYIRRERYAGSMSRSFYVGNGVKEQDIHGKFENGILTLSIPKKKENVAEQNNYIEIEG